MARTKGSLEAFDGSFPGGHRPARCLAGFAVALAALAFILATAGGASQLVRFERPADAQILHVPADGRVILQLSASAVADGDEVELTLSPFHNAAAERASVVFAAPSLAEEPTQTRARVREPVFLDAGAIPFGHVYWGYVSLKSEDTTTQVPLALSRAAPPLLGLPAGDDPALGVPHTGRARLRVDVGGHVGYGSRIRFELSAFTADDGSHTAPVSIVESGSDPNEPVGSFALDPAARTIEVELDASGLQVEKRYEGQLTAMIGDQRFPAVEVALKRSGWARTVKLEQPVPAVRTHEGCWRCECKPEAVSVALRATAGDEGVYGITVTSASAATDHFDPPNDLDVFLVNAEDAKKPESTSSEKVNRGSSLWFLDPTDAAEVNRRSIDPGGQVLLRIVPREKLSVGEHSATLKINALNTDPTSVSTAQVKFIVRRPKAWPISVVIFGVLISYMMTKGIGLASERTKLQRRIKKIESESWLTEDRWGALPIVRAFATIASADAALKRERGIRRVKNFIKAPRLVEEHVAAVEAQLPFLRRLNEVAIYWRVAPSSAQDRTGASQPVRRRAGKAIRSLVSELSRLQSGEEIGPALQGRLTALETWRDPAQVEVAYWVHLRADILLLRDAVQLSRWPTDPARASALEQALKSAQELLQKEAGSRPDDAPLRAAVVATGKALEEFARLDSQGTDPIREALEGALEKLPPAERKELDEALDAVDDSDREVVRRLWLALDPTTPPADLNVAIAREATYGKLKLIWEKRGADILENLIQLARDDEDAQKFYDAVDDESWRLLSVKDANDVATGVKVVDPVRDGAIEAYQLITFEAVATDAEADTYLFKHGLSYEWAIEIRPQPTKRKVKISKPESAGGSVPAAGEADKPEGSGPNAVTPPETDPAKRIRTLRPVTSSPRVTQFVPVANAVVTPRVTVKRKGKGEIPIEREPFVTAESTALSELWVLQSPEVVGTALALGLAVIAGMQSDAFEAALAGSWNEYGLLFAWGVAADQGKNLLQNLNNLTGST